MAELNTSDKKYLVLTPKQTGVEISVVYTEPSDRLVKYFIFDDDIVHRFVLYIIDYPEALNPRNPKYFTSNLALLLREFSNQGDWFLDYLKVEVPKVSGLTSDKVDPWIKGLTTYNSELTRKTYDYLKETIG